MKKDNMTPMMKQYFRIKAENMDHILFYRLGDFYEMFYEDAVIGSEVLDIVLSSRNAGGGEKAPLCGVPFHSAKPYISKLVNSGFSVAICEQLEEPSKTKTIVKRGVVKIITKGTLTDLDMLEEKENNYLAAIYRIDNRYSLSFADLSTFEIKSILIDESKLINEINIRNISEVLIKNDEKLKFDIKTTILDASYFKTKSYNIISKFIDVKIEEHHKFTLNALLEYIISTQMIDFNIKFKYQVYDDKSFLSLDSSAIRNIEMFKSLGDKSKKGSMIYYLDNCKSAVGSRLLRQWLEKPLLNKSIIEKRLNNVEILYNNIITRKKIRDSISKTKDIERIVASLILGTIMPRQILSILSSLKEADFLKDELKLIDNFDIVNITPLKEVERLIYKTLDEDSPATLKDGGYIKKGNNKELDNLRYIIDNGNSMLLELERKESLKTNIKNLRIKYNRVFGYFFEVTNSYLDIVPDYFIRKQTLTGSERYFTKELKELEEEIIGAKEKANELERLIYKELLSKLVDESNKLLDLSRNIAILDVISNLAHIAYENNYIKPVFNDENIIDIKEGRHLVVENIIGKENYISNDILIGKEEKFHLITGPNMAGKSTYLRQNAVIIILAHIGSFVPCKYASLPIIDAVFTRVGASDDISKGYSTFMVEMNELAYILNNATKNSFVLLDEIGRGTSTTDGLSIARATCDYLTTKIRPYVLFATHFHELTKLENNNIKNFSTDAKKIGNNLVFLHKIKEGGSDKSYGIEAARLAGIPEKVIKQSQFYSDEYDNQAILAHKSNIIESKFSNNENKFILEQLENIKLDDLSPIKAWHLLKEIKDKYEDNKPIR